MHAEVQKNQQTNHYERLFQILVVLIIMAGITLRAAKYVPNWSMRGDELAVIFNLLSRSTFELVTKPLDYEQAAPFGFLLLTKALMVLLGQSEYVLRAISFLAGCASLTLLYKLLMRVTGRHGTIFALVAFAFAYYPIYYSAELKQYSSDILITILIVLFFLNHISREANGRDFWQLGIIGILALCLSHPAIFVLIGAGFTLFVHYFIHNKQKLFWISFLGIAWAGLFLAIYLILLRHQTTSEYLTTFWRNLNSFMPVPPWKNPLWFFQATRHLFTTLCGLPPTGIFILAPIYLYGQWRFFKEKQWQWIGITIIPIGINMFVSGFEKFPFHGRLIIYLLPLVYIVFAKGIEGLMLLLSTRTLSNALYGILIAVLLLPNAVSVSNMFLVTKSYLQDDFKPILQKVEAEKQSDDIIYLYHYAKRQFTYYAPYYQLDGLTVIQGEDRTRNATRYYKDLDELPRGQRIWFVFSFVNDARIEKTQKVDERDFILEYLMKNGTLVTESYSINDASSVHLFILK